MQVLTVGTAPVLASFAPSRLYFLPLQELQELKRKENLEGPLKREAEEALATTPVKKEVDHGCDRASPVVPPCLRDPYMIEILDSPLGSPRALVLRCSEFWSLVTEATKGPTTSENQSKSPKRYPNNQQAYSKLCMQNTRVSGVCHLTNLKGQNTKMH